MVGRTDWRGSWVKPGWYEVEPTTDGKLVKRNDVSVVDGTREAAIEMDRLPEGNRC